MCQCSAIVLWQRILSPIVIKIHETKTTGRYEDNDSDRNGHIIDTRHKPCKATVATVHKYNKNIRQQEAAARQH